MFVFRNSTADWQAPEQDRIKNDAIKELPNVIFKNIVYSILLQNCNSI